jgi:hypothetical protein
VGMPDTARRYSVARYSRSRTTGTATLVDGELLVTPAPMLHQLVLGRAPDSTR